MLKENHTVCILKAVGIPVGTANAQLVYDQTAIAEE